MSLIVDLISPFSQTHPSINETTMMGVMMESIRRRMAPQRGDVTAIHDHPTTDVSLSNNNAPNTIGEASTKVATAQ
ncbi:MAG: hypothetical protein SOV24_03195 [Muribaculaceae bacterium]|nr:hypothetical protein [Bacteroidales bacterium]MDY2733353.1 hypothetical protein [Muribaculaceae bacterium]